MFHLRYEYYSESYPRFHVYKLREWQQIQQYILHENFTQILKKSTEYSKYKNIFLLDEKRFSFFRFDVYVNVEEKYTLQTLQKLIEEKINGIKKEKVHGDILYSYVDNIYVYWEKKNFLIGQKWEIFFRLYIIHVDQITINEVKRLYWEIKENPVITLVPQSFHTILFLTNWLKKENFLLLYITENYSKVIRVKQWFYDSVEVLNLWINSLKQMYKDNAIFQYWYKDYESIESNVLAKDLVVQTLEFYSQLFCKRMFDKWFLGNDVFVVSPIVKNGHFMEVFNTEYSKISNNYIVPFHYSEELESFGMQREPESMDTLIFLNREKKLFGLEK